MQFLTENEDRVELCVDQEEAWLIIHPHFIQDPSSRVILTLPDTSLLYGLVQGANYARTAIAVEFEEEERK